MPETSKSLNFHCNRLGRITIYNEVTVSDPVFPKGIPGMTGLGGFLNESATGYAGNGVASRASREVHWKGNLFAWTFAFPFLRRIHGHE